MQEMYVMHHVPVIQTARMAITGWHVLRLAIAKDLVTTSSGVDARKKIAWKAGWDITVKMVSLISMWELMCVWCVDFLAPERTTEKLLWAWGCDLVKPNCRSVEISCANGYSKSLLTLFPGGKVIASIMKCGWNRYIPKLQRCNRWWLGMD